jgi:hypothetical protein
METSNESNKFLFLKYEFPFNSPWHDSIVQFDSFERLNKFNQLNLNNHYIYIFKQALQVEYDSQLIYDISYVKIIWCLCMKKQE